MKRCMRSLSAHIGVCVAALVGVAGAASAAPLAFTSSVQLQSPAPESGVNIGGIGPVSVAYGAAGYTVISGAWRAARWADDGSGMPLGHVPGQTTLTSYAHGINHSGQTAGNASFSGASG